MKSAKFTPPNAGAAGSSALGLTGAVAAAGVGGGSVPMDRPYLQINTAAGRKQLVLSKDPISIGRHHENKLVLPDSMVSRFHCVIEKVPDGYLIRDLGASNPTRVNGRVVKSALLAPGDEIMVGSTKLVLVTPGEPHVDGEPPSAQDTMSGGKGKKKKKAKAAEPETLDELEEVEELT